MKVVLNFPDRRDFQGSGGVVGRHINLEREQTGLRLKVNHLWGTRVPGLIGKSDREVIRQAEGHKRGDGRHVSTDDP
jgi:hypothetical protein